MKSKWGLWRMLLCGGLILALALATTGCDDDDDRSSDDPAIAEASGDGGDGESGGESTPEGTDDGATAEADPASEDLESIRPPDLTPPALASPANNATLFTSQSSLKITFRWNAVEGATGYRLFINDSGTLTDGTSLIKSCNIGDGQRWYVQAVWGLRAGPISDVRRFNVRSSSGGL